MERKNKLLQTFRGVKEVKAIPMDEFEAIENGICRPNEDNHEWRLGYKVVYEDGYESWSPKDVFQKAYKKAETYKDRLEIELEELNEKLQKLSLFIASEKFDNLDEVDKVLLKNQEYVMTNYRDILLQRTKR